jgi:hypothetical protein
MPLQARRKKGPVGEPGWWLGLGQRRVPAARAALEVTSERAWCGSDLNAKVALHHNDSAYRLLFLKAFVCHPC